MATVPDPGSPRVLPSATPAQQSPDVVPAAFGASVLGEGLKNIAVTQQRAADMLERHAQGMQEIDNRTESNAAQAMLMERLQTITHGPDGYINQRGQHAVDAYGSTLTAVHEARTDLAESLSNPMSRAMFDAESRQTTSAYVATVADHYANERRESITNTNAALVSNAVNNVAANPNDADQLAASFRVIDNAVSTVAANDGVSGPVLEQRLSAAHSAAYAAATRRLAASNPEAAGRFLDQHAGDMTAEDFNNVAPYIHNLTDPYAADRVAQEVISGQTTAGGTFRSPISGGPLHLNSGYGYRVLHGNREFHPGLDINAPAGAPGLASADGVVVHAGPMGGYGNAVVIEHPNGIRTVYGHFSSVTVAEGDHVAGGQQVGVVGSTGRSTGPHLHFEVRERGADGQWHPVNPQEFLGRTTQTSPRTGDPNTDGPVMIDEARRRAAATFSDPSQRQRVESTVNSFVGTQQNEYNMRIATNNQIIQSRVNQLTATGGMVSLPMLLADPEVAAAYNGLPPVQQHVVTRNLDGYNNQDTDARTRNYYRLHGLAQRAPDQFRAANLMGENLSNRDRHTLINLQTNAAQLQQRSAQLNRAMSLVSRMSQYHLQPNTANYDQFNGALIGAVDNFIANNPQHRQPSDEEIRALALPLFATVGRTAVPLTGGAYVWGGRPAYQTTVPPAIRARIIAGQQARNRPTDDNTIRQIYITAYGVPRQ